MIDTLHAPRLASRRLPAGPAFYLLASIVLFFLASSSAPTPLYSVYQAEWGFSPIATTVVFGVYALAVLAGLLTVGSLSDHVGRRPVLIAATAAQAGTMAIFVTADGVPMLMAARVAQGLATGAALGAIGAAMIDLNRTKGTVANAVAPMTGTALGGLLSGLMVQYLPAPTHFVYLALGVIFLLQTLGVVLMRETSSPRPGALASLKIQFALPRHVRAPFMLAIPALVASWAVAGLYGALGPTLVHLLIGRNSFVLGGLALFVLAGSGALAVLVLRDVAARAVAAYGATALLVGVGVNVLAIGAGSTTWFFVSATVAGTGFGAAFQGAIRSVVPLARPHERAGVLSLLYVISYLSMGVPAVVAGFLVVDGGGVLATAQQYGVAVMILSVLALAGAIRRPRPVRAEVDSLDLELADAA